jgi:hypothetical protein
MTRAVEHGPGSKVPGRPTAQAGDAAVASERSPLAASSERARASPGRRSAVFFFFFLFFFLYLFLSNK